MKTLLTILLFAGNLTAGSYTSDLNLYKPAKYDTNYITPFATGMDTLDAAIPDKRSGKNPIFASSVTFQNKIALMDALSNEYGVILGTTTKINLFSGKYIQFHTRGALGPFNSGSDGIAFWNESNSWNGTLQLGAYGAKIYSVGSNITADQRIGISTDTPAYLLDVYGDGHFTSSMTVDGGYYGDGSNLTGVDDNLGNHIATMTLNMASFDIVNVSSISFLSNVEISSASMSQYGGILASTHVYVNGDVHAIKYYGDGSNLTGISSGDDLGSHIATTTLQMVNFGINTSSAVSAARYQINGSTVVAVLPSGVAIGEDAGRLTSGGYNTFTGYQAGYNNTSGYNSVFIGYKSGYEHISGRNNTFIGYNAGLDLTTGDYNTLVGTEAGDNIIDGSENVFVGHSVGHFLTSGSYNIVIGDAGMWRSETGVANTLIGHHVAMGSAGQSFSNSTMVGYEAGKSIQTGSNNILIGYQAGDNITTGSSNIVIGFNENPTSLTGDNQLNIGGAITGGMLNTSTITFIGYLQSRGYSDTTPYPKEKAKAYAVVKSMKSDLDGSVDHDSMDEYIKTHYTVSELTGYKTVIESYTVGCSSCPGGEYIQEVEKQEPVYSEVPKIGRDISATISSQNEVIKDLILRIVALEAK